MRKSIDISPGVHRHTATFQLQKMQTSISVQSVAIHKLCNQATEDHQQLPKSTPSAPPDAVLVNTAVSSRTFTKPNTRKQQRQLCVCVYGSLCLHTHRQTLIAHGGTGYTLGSVWILDSGYTMAWGGVIFPCPLGRVKAMVSSRWREGAELCHLLRSAHEPPVHGFHETTKEMLVPCHSNQLQRSSLQPSAPDKHQQA